MNITEDNFQSKFMERTGKDKSGQDRTRLIYFFGMTTGGEG